MLKDETRKNDFVATFFWQMLRFHRDDGDSAPCILFFFFIRLPDAAASFGVSKDHSNKRQLAAPVCKKQVSRTKPDFEYLSFSAGCDVSSLSGDVIVL